jgi:hypothetical protein
MDPAIERLLDVAQELLALREENLSESLLVALSQRVTLAFG